MVQAVLASPDTGVVPRSIGTLTLTTKNVGGQSGLDRFRTSGATKVAFPRRSDAVEGIMLNTSGGLTGGDRFDATASAGPDSRLVLTTQAAERAYRSVSGRAQGRTCLNAARGATLHWLPQELIVFDGAALDRRLDIEVSDSAEAVVIEPVVFGRRAMGETQVTASFRDRVTLRRNNAPLYWDRINLSGDISRQLDRPAIAGGMTAVASGLYVGSRAEALLPLIRQLLPRTGGASLIAPDLLTLRILAADSFDLRKTLVPLMELMTQSPLPKSWSL